MGYQHVLIFTILFIYSANINEINAIRCAKDCWIGPVKLGSKMPFIQPCDVIEVDRKTTACTVSLAIRLQNDYVVGMLDAKPRVVDATSTLVTVLDMNRHNTGSMVNYTCTLTDNCDQEFVIEAIGSSKWSQLNETSTREKISSLLIDDSFAEKNFTCAHNTTCQTPSDNCRADYIQQSIYPHTNTTTFNNNYECIINYMTEIAVFNYFEVPSTNHTTATYLMCDRNQCNERDTVERAFNILKNEFTLPLNYSQFIPKNEFIFLSLTHFEK